MIDVEELGRLPRTPRVKGFPITPRLPQSLKPPGESSEDLFTQRFNAIRDSRYPAMTRPEFKVYEWLQQRYGKDSENHDWAYTVSTLVSVRPGGIEVDFNIYAEGLLVWQVQGTYFHFTTPEQQASDRVERVWLESAGYTVVNMLDTMIEMDVDRVCKAGLKGEQLYQDPIFGGYVPGFGVRT